MKLILLYFSNAHLSSVCWVSGSLHDLCDSGSPSRKSLGCKCVFTHSLNHLTSVPVTYNRRATHLTICTEEGFKWLNPECNKGSDDPTKWASGEELEAIKDISEHLRTFGDGFTGFPMGKNAITPENVLVAVVSRFYAEPEGEGWSEKGDSRYSDILCGVEKMLKTCDKDGKLACKYNLYPHRLIIANIMAVGCDTVCGNDDFYVCLEKRETVSPTGFNVGRRPNE